MGELKNINFLRMGEFTTVCFINTEEGEESVGHFINTVKAKREDEEYHALKNALHNLVSTRDKEEETN